MCMEEFPIFLSCASLRHGILSFWSGNHAEEQGSKKVPLDFPGVTAEHWWVDILYRMLCALMKKAVTKYNFRILPSLLLCALGSYTNKANRSVPRR